MVNKGKRKNTYQSAGTSIKLQKKDDKIITVSKVCSDGNNDVYSNLPHEILLKIFMFLSISDRCQLARLVTTFIYF